MSPSKSNTSFPAQAGIYFDDFITRNRWKIKEKLRQLQMSAMPPANVFETRDGFIIELVLPGLSIEDLEFEITERKLTVRYESNKPDFEPINQHRTWRQEFSLPSFERQFDLHPEIVILDSMEVEENNGLITIFFYKKPELEGKMLPLVPFSMN